MQLAEDLKEWAEDLTIGRKVQYLVTAGGVGYSAYIFNDFLTTFSGVAQNLGELTLKQVAALAIVSNLFIFSFFCLFLAMRAAPTVGYWAGYAVDLYFDNFEEVEEEE